MGTTEKFTQARHTLDWDERWSLKEAMTKLAEANFSDKEYDYQSALAKAHDAVSKLRKTGSKGEAFKEEEANLSAFLHTYMRKYMDDSVSVLLWQQLHDNIDNRVWHAFVKNISAAKLDTKKKRALFKTDWFKSCANLERLVRYVVRLDNETKERMLYHSLILWDAESFMGAIEMFYGE